MIRSPAKIKKQKGFIQVFGVPLSTSVVRSDGMGDYTLIQDAIDALTVSPWIIEIQSDIQGSTEYFLEELTFPSNGGEGTEIILRGRTGDTIVVYTDMGGSTGRITDMEGTSYWIFDNIELGRDETLNGWNYSTDPLKGKALVEHKRWSQDITGTSHHITFINCTMYGGSFFDSGVFEEGTEFYAFVNCTLLYSGINGEKVGDDPDPGGNNLQFKGDRCIYVNCFFKWGGHDNLSMETSYQVMWKCMCDGDWSDFTLPPGESQANNGLGNRAGPTMVGPKGNAPYGPNLIHKCIARNADEDLENPEQSGGKFEAYRGIVRYCYIYDIVEGPAMQQSGPGTTTPTSAQGDDEFHHYCNTFDLCQYIIHSTDGNSKANSDGHYVDWRTEANIMVATTGRDSDGAHIRLNRNNSAKRPGDPDDYRGVQYKNNICYSTAGPFVFRLIGDGGSSQSGVAAAEAAYPLVYSGNTELPPTYKVQGDRQSDNYQVAVSAFELASGSEGLNTNHPRTNANGSGAGSDQLTVDDSIWFAVLSDPNTWDLGYFVNMGFIPSGDYIKIVPAGMDPLTNGEIVQLTAIDYENHIMTLASDKSWSDGDDIFHVDEDGVTVCNNTGAWQGAAP